MGSHYQMVVEQPCTEAKTRNLHSYIAAAEYANAIPSREGREERGAQCISAGSEIERISGRAVEMLCYKKFMDCGEGGGKGWAGSSLKELSSSKMPSLDVKFSWKGALLLKWVGFPQPWRMPIPLPACPGWQPHKKGLREEFLAGARWFIGTRKGLLLGRAQQVSGGNPAFWSVNNRPTLVIFLGEGICWCRWGKCGQSDITLRC